MQQVHSRAAAKFPQAQPAKLALHRNVHGECFAVNFAVIVIQQVADPGSGRVPRIFSDALRRAVLARKSSFNVPALVPSRAFVMPRPRGGYRSFRGNVQTTCSEDDFAAGQVATAKSDSLFLVPAQGGERRRAARVKIFHARRYYGIRTSHTGW